MFPWLFPRHVQGGEPIWFHEDDYCQIELLPRAAEAFARGEAEKIRAFGEAHKAPDGIGWTDIYRAKAPPATVHDLKIHIDKLKECVPPSLGLFERVTTGYSTHVERAERTVAWGREGRALIFADSDELQVVQHIWFDHFGRSSTDDMRSFLGACTARWDVLLCDWAWTQVVDPRDTSALDSYLVLRESRRA